MTTLHLDTRMKLMNRDNKSHPLNTNFVYEVPFYIYNYEGLKVVCSLVDDVTMSYSLSDSFNLLMNDNKLNTEVVVKKIESLLWGLSTLKIVSLEESQEKAYLIKEGLFIR